MEKANQEENKSVEVLEKDIENIAGNAGEIIQSIRDNAGDVMFKMKEIMARVPEGLQGKLQEVVGKLEQISGRATEFFDSLVTKRLPPAVKATLILVLGTVALHQEAQGQVMSGKSAYQLRTSAEAAILLMGEEGEKTKLYIEKDSAAQEYQLHFKEENLDVSNPYFVVEKGKIPQDVKDWYEEMFNAPGTLFICGSLEEARDQYPHAGVDIFEVKVPVYARGEDGELITGEDGQAKRISVRKMIVVKKAGGYGGKNPGKKIAGIDNSGADSVGD